MSVQALSELAHCVVVSLDKRLTAAEAVRIIQELAAFGPEADRWTPLTPRLASFPNFWMALGNAMLFVDGPALADLTECSVKFEDMLISMRSAWSTEGEHHLYAVVCGVADRFRYCTVAQGDARARYDQADLERHGYPPVF